MAATWLDLFCHSPLAHSRHTLCELPHGSVRGSAKSIKHTGHVSSSSKSSANMTASVGWRLTTAPRACVPLQILIVSNTTATPLISEKRQMRLFRLRALPVRAGDEYLPGKRTAGRTALACGRLSIFPYRAIINVISFLLLREPAGPAHAAARQITTPRPNAICAQDTTCAPTASSATSTASVCARPALLGWQGPLRVCVPPGVFARTRAVACARAHPPGTRAAQLPWSRRLTGDFACV